MRESKGLSQRQPGIEAGFDESGANARMNQYETGKHHPDLRTVEKLSSVLGVPVPFLYCDDDDLAKVIAKFLKLNDSDKQRILKIIAKAE